MNMLCDHVDAIVFFLVTLYGSVTVYWMYYYGVFLLKSPETIAVSFLAKDEFYETKRLPIELVYLSFSGFPTTLSFKRF